MFCRIYGQCFLLFISSCPLESFCGVPEKSYLLRNIFLFSTVEHIFSTIEYIFSTVEYMFNTAE